MSLKDFRVIDSIGKGSFASVYKVIRKSDNKIYALKKVKINKMSKKEIADAVNEIRFLASIRHKNIVGFLEAFLENNETELCIVMEYCGCGDLAQKVERYKRRKTYIDEDVIWRYLIQSLKALSYIHERNICHRDIKTANSFLAEDGSVKMGDMNVSKKLKRGQLQTQIGTPYYMSPEIWNNRAYDASSDIWSLGCMIYELCALKPPFTGTDFPSLKRAVTAGRFSSIPRKYTEGLGRVISSMLRLNPRDRPSADALLRSNELSAKLQLDEVQGVSFSNAADQRKQLLQTILVPHNLRNLNNALPKPAYPDKESAPAPAAAPSKGKDEASAVESSNVAPPLPPAPVASKKHHGHGHGHEKEAPSARRAPLAPVDENKGHHHHPRHAHAPAPPAAKHAAPSGGNVPGVPYSARPGRLNIQQYNSAVSKYSQHNYHQHGHGHGHHGMAPPSGAAGVGSRVQSHRIW